MLNSELLTPRLRAGVRRTRRTAKIARRRRTAKSRGIAFLPPNYIFMDTIGSTSTVIDVGCGSAAELSQQMIESRGVRAFGVDPTRKHRPSLEAIERRTDRFTHIPVAVAARAGRLTFYESIENESGSLLESHVNATQTQTRSYDVDAVTLRDLLVRSSVDTVEYLKLDLEGAEYDLLREATRDDLAPFGQVFVEFHHHAIPERTQRDTQELVDLIERVGLTSFSLDDHNVLFYRC